MLLPINLFLTLLPLSLVTGPFLPDLFISLMGIFFILSNFKNYRQYLEFKFVKLFLIFFSYLIFVTLFSYDIFISFESSLFYFRFLFFSLSVLYILKNNEKIILYLIFSFSFTFLLIYFDSLIQLFFGKNLTGYQYDKRSGINSFFGENDDGILGSYVVRLMPIFCSLLAYQFIDKVKFIKYPIIILLLTSSIIAMLAQERAAFMLSLIPLFFIIYFSDFFKNKEKALISFLILILIIVVLLISDEIFTRFIIAVKNQLFINGNIVFFSEKHQAHYLSSINMFLDQPFFGIGPKMFRFYCDDIRYFVENACSTHPHNNYLQLLAETGVFSFFIVFGVFLYFLNILRKQFFLLYFKKEIGHSAHYILIISAIIISLWPLTPTGNFFNNWINVIYYFPVGIFLFFHEKESI